jgi:hypothetical protein
MSRKILLHQANTSQSDEIKPGFLRSYLKPRHKRSNFLFLPEQSRSKRRFSTNGGLLALTLDLTKEWPNDISAIARCCVHYVWPSKRGAQICPYTPFSETLSLSAAIRTSLRARAGSCLRLVGSEIIIGSPAHPPGGPGCRSTGAGRPCSGRSSSPAAAACHCSDSPPGPGGPGEPATGRPLRPLSLSPSRILRLMIATK